MTKAELIDAIQIQTHGYSKSDIGEILVALGKVVTAELAAANNDAEADAEVVLPGLGKFHSIIKSARDGRNPKTGGVIKIPAKRVVTFKAGKELREAVAGE